MDAPTEGKWEVAAEELYKIREEMRLLKQREQDIVSTFKGFGAGVYAGTSYTITVSEYQRAVVDIDGLREFDPALVDSYTEHRSYLAVKAAPIAIKLD